MNSLINCSSITCGLDHIPSPTCLLNLQNSACQEDMLLQNVPIIYSPVSFYLYSGSVQELRNYAAASQSMAPMQESDEG